MPSAADWITLAEAQAILAAANVHFTTSTIGGWARAGRLQSIKLGGRRYVRRGEVRALIAAPRRVPADVGPARAVRGRAGLTRRRWTPARSSSAPRAAAGRLVIVRVLDAYGRAPGGLLANGLAFAALFATFPIALVVLGVAGLIAGDPAVAGPARRGPASRVPAAGRLRRPGAGGPRCRAPPSRRCSASSASIWTVSQFYVTLDIAFARIFAGIDRARPVRRTARGFLWVAVLLALVVGAIVARARCCDAVVPLFPDVRLGDRPGDRRSGVDLVADARRLGIAVIGLALPDRCRRGRRRGGRSGCRRSSRASRSSC